MWATRIASPWVVISTLSLLTLGASSWAFDLSPKGTKLDQAAVKEWSSVLDRILSTLADSGLQKFKESVHEEITHRTFKCNYEGATRCGDPDAEFATPYVIAGIRWNDDPPFQLNDKQAKGMHCKIRYEDGRRMTIRFITQPVCWGNLFFHGEKQIKQSPNDKFDQSTQAALPLRSHFGDLQFIHSMASADNEDPVETRRKILGWAQFTWGVVRGEFKLETWLKDIDQPVVRQYFGGSNWRVQDLFALGDQSLRDHIDEVAFGSLLHMTQDGFAAGHVERLDPAADSTCPGTTLLMPGPVLEFHSYTGQSSSSHALADTRNAFVNNRLSPDVVEVGKELLLLRKHKAAWAEVESYLMCVYNFAPNVRGASAGAFE